MKTIQVIKSLQLNSYSSGFFLTIDHVESFLFSLLDKMHEFVTMLY
jgi:hypothetical protein